MTGMAPQYLVLAAAAIAVGYLVGGWRTAAIGLVAFILGYLARTYVDRVPPWKFK